MASCVRNPDLTLSREDLELDGMTIRHLHSDVNRIELNMWNALYIDIAVLLGALGCSDQSILRKLKWYAAYLFFGMSSRIILNLYGDSANLYCASTNTLFKWRCKSGYSCKGQKHG